MTESSRSAAPGSDLPEFEALASEAVHGSPAGSKQTKYKRFTLSDRVEHLLLLTSFTVLVITGIPQKFLPAGWAEFMINLMGGIEVVRIIHRISASVLIFESVYHLFAVTYKLLVLRRAPSMLPGSKDFVDFLVTVRHNMGLGRQAPRYDRYNFEEKVEYWAVIWGTLVMIATGFILWNPILTTKLLAGSAIPAAKAAHGGEALLAFLAIVVWHLWGVHIRTFNKSMFTGSLSREQMEHEHVLELERIDSGLQRPLPPSAAVRRRQRLFLPVAGLLFATIILTTYFFLTYEQTAIATVPPSPDRGHVFTPATPAPEAATDAERLAVLGRGPAKAVPHEITGRENCLSCHGLGAIKPFSSVHAELRLGNESCLGCHPIATSTPPLTAQANAAPSYFTDIFPVFQKRCVACHNATAKLDLTSYASLMKGGAEGPVIVPADVEGSRLVLVQTMPLAAHPTRLTEQELALVRAWVQAGAPEN